MDIARPELAQQKQRKRLILAGVGALIFAASAYAIFNMEPAMPSLDKATVSTDTVKRGDLMIEVRGIGVLVPKTTRWIAAETSARVERIVVKRVTHVRCC
jgi:HlyD family secretion protein